jgi:hypothetical protein
LVPTTCLTGHQTGYFYDPAVPGRPDASRAVLGDRASWRYLPATSGENHRNVMNFVGSDGHSGKAKLINPGLATVSAMSPEVPGDDLLSGTGDGGTPTARGGGASQKAWLR